MRWIHRTEATWVDHRFGDLGEMRQLSLEGAELSLEPLSAGSDFI
jgi:hypothetical protein